MFWWFPVSHCYTHDCGSFGWWQLGSGQGRHLPTAWSRASLPEPREGTHDWQESQAKPFSTREQLPHPQQQFLIFLNEEDLGKIYEPTEKGRRVFSTLRSEEDR